MPFVQYTKSSAPAAKRLHPGTVLFYIAKPTDPRKMTERKVFMTLNPSDANQILGGKHTHVTLFYDADTNRIGLKPCKASKSAMKVRRNTYQPWVYLSGLVRRFGLSITKGLSAPIHHSEVDGMWIVQLPQSETQPE
jgi:hypothetical protein